MVAPDPGDVTPGQQRNRLADGLPRLEHVAQANDPVNPVAITLRECQFQIGDLLVNVRDNAKFHAFIAPKKRPGSMLPEPSFTPLSATVATQEGLTVQALCP